MRDHRNCTPHSHEEALKRDFPTRPEIEHEQQEKQR